MIPHINGIATRCADTSTTIGISRCHHFGGWSEKIFLATDIDAIEQTIHPSGSETLLHAGGLRMAGIVGLGHYLYIGIDATVSGYEAPVGGPELVTTDMPMQSNLVFGDHFLIGAHGQIGDLTFRGELAPGTLATDLGPAYVFETQLAVQAHVDWWIAPKVSVGALASMNVLDSREVMFGIGIGGHGVAWDGMR